MNDSLQLWTEYTIISVSEGTWRSPTLTYCMNDSPQIWTEYNITSESEGTWRSPTLTYSMNDSLQLWTEYILINVSEGTWRSPTLTYCMNDSLQLETAELALCDGLCWQTVCYGVILFGQIQRLQSQQTNDITKDQLCVSCLLLSALKHSNQANTNLKRKKGKKNRHYFVH